MTIRIHLQVTDVTAGWPDVSGVDVTATNRAYCAALERHLHEAYPGAEVTVVSFPNVTGPLPDDIQADSDQEVDAILTTIAMITDGLANNSEAWVVMTSIQHAQA